MKKRLLGFTLVELMVTLSISSVLTAGIFSVFSNFKQT
ncbi:MAG: prepilin-type N-terminal cleavage/methylation domain-containing protein [Methylococcales bacterium]|jgi:prepilin-type N-terminal cleavage/methylation domain-containing protein|nr:prepilin-type N-terminal cleavage/methylation domain-containing protein [Methylococcales bacterium]MBT7442550.1 prepilin-type N-terminal cleavage/methylation domain-containing protein [Methylococcales bacterium]